MTIQTDEDKYLDSILAPGGDVALSSMERRVVAQLRGLDAELPALKKRIEMLEFQKQITEKQLAAAAAQAQALAALLVAEENARTPADDSKPEPATI